jgi:hypothetical protein
MKIPVEVIGFDKLAIPNRCCGVNASPLSRSATPKGPDMGRFSLHRDGHRATWDCWPHTRAGTRLMARGERPV